MGDSPPFFNESMRNFSSSATRAEFAAAVSRATVPKVANDRTPDQGKAMMNRAAAIFDQWRDAPAVKRAEVLVKVAAAMHKRARCPRWRHHRERKRQDLA